MKKLFRKSKKLNGFRRKDTIVFKRLLQSDLIGVFHVSVFGEFQYHYLSIKKLVNYSEMRKLLKELLKFLKKKGQMLGLFVRHKIFWAINTKLRTTIKILIP